MDEKNLHLARVIASRSTRTVAIAMDEGEDSEKKGSSSSAVDKLSMFR